MTSAQPIWLTPHAHKLLRQELAVLRRYTGAAAGGDGDEDSTAVAVRRAQQGRIQQIHDMLVNAVIGEDPPNDGIAEPGMVVTVRYQDSGEVETFLLGVRGADYGDIEVYSVNCPLGRAICGAGPGESRTYELPDGSTQTVVMQRAVPYGLHVTSPA